MKRKHLSDDPQGIDNNTWYYEEPKGIRVVHHSNQCVIPWNMILKSVSRHKAALKAGKGEETMKEIPMLERELTYDEQSRWGTCPICKVHHGESCLKFGLTLSGTYPENGVHMLRLQAAPKKVKLVPAD